MRRLNKRTVKIMTAFSAVLVAISVMFSLMQPGIALTGSEVESDPNADVEDASVWQASFANSGYNQAENWNEAVTAIAESQIGYAESTNNFNEENKGYTRYGAWASSSGEDKTYNDWNTLFVEFVLHYAGVYTNYFPVQDDIQAWIQSLSNKGLYTTEYTEGDLVFFNKNGNTSVGIIDTINESSSSITVIEGDSNDRVEENTYTLNSNILGYGSVSTAYSNYQEALGIKQDDAQEETKESSNQEEIDDSEDDIMLIDNGTIDMTDMITSATMQRRQYGSSGDWQDITSSTPANYTDSLRASIEYTVPGKTLSSDNRTITYTLPSQYLNFGSDSGTVQTSAGVDAGKYEIKDGVVTITFNDNFVTSNQNGSEITGWLRLNCSVKKDTAQSETEIPIKFNDKVTYNIYVQKDEALKGDITVSKDIVSQNDATGEITYRINVSSTNGTSTQVELTDTMTNTTLKNGGNFTVKKKWQSIDSGYTINTNDTGFTATLPQMEAGDSYQIEYTAVLKDEYKGYTATANNKIVAKSTNSDHKEITSEKEVSTKFKPFINKTSSVNNEDGTITYTITLNKGKINLKGWKLSDTYNGQALPGKVTMTDENGNSKEVTLPYTFSSDDTHTYTITYKTDIPYTTGVNIPNKATATNGSKTESSETSNWVSRSPISKTGTGVTLNDDSTITLNWKINMHISDDMKDGWTLEDTLKNGQYLTPKQITALKKTLDDVFGTNNYTLTSDQGTEYSKDNTENWTGFKIVSKEGTTWKYGNEYKIEVSSTASVPENETNYQNHIAINNWTADGYNNFKPSDYIVVTKTDANNEGGGSSTTHDNHDQNINGVLKWNIKLKVTDKVKESDEITITEHLPSGVTFKEMTCNYQSVTWNGDTGTAQVNGGTVTIKKNSDNTLTIKVPKACYQSTTEIPFQIQVKLDNADKTDWTQETYKNSVTVTDENNKEIGSASQTQTITNKDQTSYVSKKGNTVEGSNKLIYEVKINEKGEDLLQDGDGGKLTLQDVMTYHYNPYYGKFKFTLVPGSVELYYLNSDGTKGEKISSNLYSYTYQESAVVSGTTNNNGDYEQDRTNTLNLIVPDNTAIMLVYQYKADGVNGTNTTPVNTASLSGEGKSYGSSSSSTYIVYKDSSAGADIKGINVYKVDSENYGTYLQGAEFTLYKYDPTSKEWVEDDTYKSLVSDSTGLVSLSDLQHNQAYKLVETKTPADYQITTGYEDGYLFYIVDGDTSKYPMKVPDNFTGDRLSSGQTVYLPNKKVVQYELPSTGGTGTLNYYFCGTAIMSIAVLLYVYIQTRCRRRRNCS